MTRRLIILSVILLTGTISLFAQINSSAKDTNLLKVNGYINMIIDQTPPIPDSLIKISEFLIGVSKDSVMKTYVARFLFDKFFNSPVMGMETPAIYLAKNYFLNRKLGGLHSADLESLRLFVEFNKNSLIGMDAPELKMENNRGDSVSLRSLKSQYTLLYFYDDECSVCKSEAPKIKAVLRENSDLNISVYAVYVQSSKENWQADIKKSYPPDSLAGHNWNFLWDSEMQSDYQRLYGVLSTPKLFLIDSDKKIVGRNLNAAALSDLLRALNINVNEQKARLVLFFTNYFKNFNPTDTLSFKIALDALYERSKEDKDMFRSIFSELYLFLKYSKDNNLKNGAITLAQNYIIAKPELWNEEYVEKMRKSVSQALKNPFGSIAPTLVLRNLKGKKIDTGKIVADSLILMFFDIECPICNSERQELQKKYSDYKAKGIEVVAIYTGSNIAGLKKYVTDNKIEWISLWDKTGKSGIYNKYDLSGVPAVYLLNKQKQILAKDLNMKQLDSYIK